MADPSSPPAKRRPPEADTPTIPARWGFLKGLLTGAVIEVPALATTVLVLGALGYGDPDVRFMQAARLAAVFAGFAALLTAGGIGRLAAHAAVVGGRRRAAFVAARAHAFAGAGLVMIAMVPHGHLPSDPWAWLPLPAAGLVMGAVCGAVIGVVCGGVTPVGLSDVMSIARRPSAAIRTLVRPEDFVKLGAALKSRTSNLFEGLFTPATPPTPAADTEAVAAPTTEAVAAAATEAADDPAPSEAPTEAAAPTETAEPAAPAPAPPTATPPADPSAR